MGNFLNHYWGPLGMHLIIGDKLNVVRKVLSLICQVSILFLVFEQARAEYNTCSFVFHLKSSDSTELMPHINRFMKVAIRRLGTLVPTRKTVGLILVVKLSRFICTQKILVIPSVLQHFTF